MCSLIMCSLMARRGTTLGVVLGIASSSPHYSNPPHRVDTTFSVCHSPLAAYTLGMYSSLRRFELAACVPLPHLAKNYKSALYFPYLGGRIRTVLSFLFPISKNPNQLAWIHALRYVISTFQWTFQGYYHLSRADLNADSEVQFPKRPRGNWLYSVAFRGRRL
jgi:hypothetical protein